MRLSKLISIILLAISFTSCVITDPTQPATLSGKVTDINGNPIQDAIIQIETKTQKTSANTSAVGKYSLSITSAGICNISVSKQGYSVQMQTLIIYGGENKSLNLTLKTLEQAAFLKVSKIYISAWNYTDSINVDISTNVNYNFESTVNWLTLVKADNHLFVKFFDNETLSQRSGKILLKGDYGITDTVYVVQTAGPPLKLLDYTGKTDANSFPYTTPFITFSREVKLVHAFTLENDIDITTQFLADNKTITFPNVKIQAFTSRTIIYRVEASDGTIYNGTLILRPFCGIVENTYYNGQKAVFTKNDETVWIFTGNSDLGTNMLIQYSTKDLKQINSIHLDGGIYDFSYNPYNNTLYVPPVTNYNGTASTIFKIYDATSAQYLGDFDPNMLGKLLFGYNGIGLFLGDSKLYYVDSSKGNSINCIANNNSFNLVLCNSQKTILSSTIVSGTSDVNYANHLNIYQFDVDSKQLSLFGSTLPSQTNFSTNSFLNKVVFFSSSSATLADLNNHTSKAINLTSGTQKAVCLYSENSDPYVLTNNLYLISFADNSSYSFVPNKANTSNTIYEMISSNDGKKVLINSNNTLYLFNSDIFTKYGSKIK